MPVGIYKHKPHLEETKKKISNAHLGKPSGMLGKKHSDTTRKKMSETAKRTGTGKWMKGRKPSKEIVEKRRKSMSGAKHYNWKGGLTPLMKRIRHCFKYRQWRSDIFTRDDFTCVICDKRGGWIEADHCPKRFSDIFHKNKIKTMEQALSCEELWDINNGRTLCRKCHEKTYKKF